jgi:hypothetical protein
MRRFLKPLYILLAILVLSAGWIALRLSQNMPDASTSPGLLSGEGGVSATGPISAAQDPPEQGGEPGHLEEHPLDPLLELAREIKQHLEQNVDDYTAILIKRERIRGELGPENKMQIKIRNRNEAKSIPLSAYIYFLEPRSVRGREVIWVEHEHGNRLISHEGGMLNLKRFKLAPDSMLAMAGNKYPITEIGLLRLTEQLIEKGERDRELGMCKVDVLDDQRVGDRKCRLYQITHPEPAGKFDFHIAQIFVDVERKLPLRYAAFLWPKGDEPPPLEEEYTYLDLKVNVGLTSIDFDPDNPEYNFPSF